MSRIAKILIAVLIAVIILTVVTSLASVTKNVLLPLVSARGHAEGELIGKSVSPSGRWEVRIYFINPGAMASSIYYARILDLRRSSPARDIPLSGEQFQKQSIRWKNENIVDIYGAEMNALSGTVLDGKSVSPDGRWKLRIYYYPLTDGRRSWDGRHVKYFYYVVVSDSKKKAPTHKIDFDESQITGERIHWKSANVVDVYGAIIDVNVAEKP